MAKVGHHPKPPLRHRPSEIIKSFAKLEDKEELALEKRNVKAAPALKTVFKGFTECVDFLKDSAKRKDKYFVQLNKQLRDKIAQAFISHDSDEERTVMGNKLAKIGFVQYLLAYYKFVNDELGIVAVTNSLVVEDMKRGDKGVILIVTIREILWNFSDGSLSFAQRITTSKLFEYLVADLEMMYEDGLTQLEKDKDLFAFSSAVGILHNCARNPDMDKDKFRDTFVIEALLPFLRCNMLYVKMLTLLALGNMIKENQVSLLDAIVDVFGFLLKALSDAMQAKDRKQYGFHIAEFIEGLSALAQSDQNKRLIMSKAPLPVVITLLGGTEVSEILAAINLIWELAFLEENKQIIVRDKELMTCIERLMNSPIYDLNYAAKKTWFVLTGKDDRAQPTKELGISSPPQPFVGLQGKHIMISYSWGDKKTVHEIYKALKKEGFPIWIDIEEMNKFPNVLDGMAHAVEEAYVVIMCVSETYKKSANCRTEADYMFQKRKEIIPLNMQKDYMADGWLGALIGTRPCIDFSPGSPFNEQIRRLRNTLPSTPTPFNPEPPRSAQPRGSRSALPRPISHHIQHVRVQTPVEAAEDTEPRVWEWKTTDVLRWARVHKFDGQALRKVSKLSGIQLHFVYKVMNKSPKTFYRWVEDTIKLGSIEDLLKFNNAIEDLEEYTY